MSTVAVHSCPNCGGPVFRGMLKCDYCGSSLSFVDIHRESPDLLVPPDPGEETVDSAIEARSSAVTTQSSGGSAAGLLAILGGGFIAGASIVLWQSPAGILVGIVLFVIGLVVA